MNKKTKINTVSTIMLQAVTIISGFIIPRLILSKFGSNVNGLIASLTQVLNYINLLEGGLSSVIMASLYVPLYDKNKKMISSVVVTTIHFFRKISIIFIIYTFLVAIFYPFLIRTPFDWDYVFTLTLILGISLFVQYCFSITWRLFLQADQKVYVASFVQILVIILNTCLTILGIKISDSIHVVKLFSASAFVLQPLIFNFYINRKYELDMNVEENKAVLTHRWDGFGINIAAFLNGNTDVTVLTIFSSLGNVSIYSIYNLVATGLKSLITAISAGIVPTLGNSYAENNKDKLNKLFNTYEIIIFFVTFTLYTCALRVIVPFVVMYTQGVEDANYAQPFFSALLLFSMMIFCLREPYVNMAYTAGKFKEVSKYAYVEAAINVIFSILFVRAWGLNGVAMGTLCSMTYRTVRQVDFLKNNILFRSRKIFYKKIIVFGLSSSLGFLCSLLIFWTKTPETWLEWILFATENSIIIMFINALFAYVFFKKDFCERR